MVVPGALRSKSTWIVGIAAAAGLSIGFLLVPRAETPDDDKAAPPLTRLLGRTLPDSEGAIAVAMEELRHFVARPVSLVMPDGHARELYMGRLGVAIDKLRLSQLIRDTRDATSALRRNRPAKPAEPLDLPVPLSIATAEALPALALLKDEVDRAPADARLDLERRQLIPETLGIELDIDATLLGLERALTRGEARVVVAYTTHKPRRTARELRDVKFDQVLGFFETSYDRSSKLQSRAYNLRLAASKLDGTVLLPGEIFAFNDVVGPRDEASGYKVAHVIAEGELVDGIGGGTCQVSGTLHAATFFAGLEIVERYPHTRPSAYIKMGLDATVVYPSIDFRFKNPFAFPVVLHETVKNGTVRAEVLGPVRARVVTLIRRIDDAVPYEEVERPDEALPQGMRVLAQRGIPGFKLHRYRIVRQGSNAVRERWNDIYPPTSQIVRVGTGPGTDKLPEAHDDAAPEYVADELLVMTQGDDDGKAEPGTREWPEPGKYGKPGWTRAMGMPVWNDVVSGEESTVESRESRVEKRRRR
jgi:vancomycin resistance protein YoaR